MHPIHDLLVQAREGAAVQLLVHHPMLLDRPEFRGRLRPDDPQGRHELRIGHLVRGPDAAGEVPGRGGVPDDLLRESREAIVLRHDHAESDQGAMAVLFCCLAWANRGGHDWARTSALNEENHASLPVSPLVASEIRPRLVERDSLW